MAFNRNAFIADAKQQGYDDEQINNYLISKGAKPIGLVDRAVLSKAVPWLGSALGAGVGAIAAPVTGGLSVPYGALAGGGATSAVQNELKNLMGYQTEKPLDQVSGALEQASLAAVLAEVPQALSTTLHPMRSLGKLREKIIGESTVPRADLESQVPEIMKGSRFYQNAPYESRQASGTRLNDLLNAVAPYKTINAAGQAAQAENVGINEIYKNLGAFEAMNRPYLASGDIPSTSMGQGSRLVSAATREYLNQNIPQSAQTINKLLSGMSSIQSGAIGKYAPRAVASAAIGLPIYSLIRTLLNQTKGQ